VLDALHELRVAARREGAEEDHLLGVLADVDEAARARQPGPELADVDVPLAVGLRHAEEGRVEAAAVVEVELRGLVHQRLDVARRAEVEPAGRQPADGARLGGQRQVLQHPLLVGDAGHALRHADAEVDDAVGPQLEGGAAGDDLARPHLHRRQERTARGFRR
jgi:hypothetical protein